MSCSGIMKVNINDVDRKGALHRHCERYRLFKYSNVTAKTHMIVAQLYEYNIDAPEINRIMFDTKSRKLLELERMVLDASEFHFGGKCILLPVTAEMQEKTGCSGTELEALPLFPAALRVLLPELR